jgi:hypothetical protein
MQEKAVHVKSMPLREILAQNMVYQT